MNKFTRELVSWEEDYGDNGEKYISLVRPDGQLLIDYQHEGRLSPEDRELIAAAFNSATTLADMGYGGLEAVKALPELVKMVRFALDMGYLNPASEHTAGTLLTRIRGEQDGE